VHQDGLFITKASEVKSRDIQIEVPDRGLCNAIVVETDDAIDIALVKATDVRSTPVPYDAWYRDKVPSPVGRMCFAAGPNAKSVGFGVVSVAARPLDGKTGAYIGVQVEAGDDGVTVKAVSPKSPAAKAGIKMGDKLLSVDQKEVRSEQQLQDIVQSHLEGDVLRLEIERGDALITIAVKLQDGTQLAPMPGAREQALDSVTAALSKRRWGFETGIQHDCAISSRDVGGPLVDLQGRIVGINIARAGRIQSYAIPSHRVLQFLESSQHMKPTNPEANPSGTRSKGGF
jgi:serine protease Do